MEERHEMRRVPRQGRSQERVRAILNAAAQLFAEVGYEAATTNAIAERAHTRIGSLYHFFSNKEAILHALADQYLQDMQAFSEQVFASEQAAALPLAEFIDGMVTAILEYDQSHVGFKEILYGSQAPDTMRQVSQQVQHTMVGAVEQGMSLRAPALAASERHAAAVIAFSAVKSILNLETADEAERQAVLRHLKLMLNAYLTTVFESVS